MSQTEFAKKTRSSTGQDIRERTFRFGVRIVKMANGLPRTAAGFELARQVIRSGTSVGANVEEADAAESKADFIHKMKIALKEAQETRYWLRTLIESEIIADDETKALLNESDELVRIINTIIRNTQKQ
ncbi:MAG: four helix bundle protein [Chloroflexi bacterium]|nr:four helix bundle protein [Chloroflexota bacterium]MBI3741601.1 four helix bundle protein [Chloroflexota bacterium]